MVRVLVLMADRCEQIDEVLIVQAVEHAPAVRNDGVIAPIAALGDHPRPQAVVTG